MRQELADVLRKFHALNIQRGERFHKMGIAEWSPLEWAGAVCGEAGELANACKKLRRMELSPGQSANDYDNREDAINHIASEAAGTFIYLDLLCERLGIDFGEAIANEFNRVSDRAKFPERVE
jgi:NTP pyrophosphatase (non-canonical NTP hydrolase)